MARAIKLSEALRHMNNGELLPQNMAHTERRGKGEKDRTDFMKWKINGNTSNIIDGKTDPFVFTIPKKQKATVFFARLYSVPWICRSGIFQSTWGKERRNKTGKVNKEVASIGSQATNKKPDKHSGRVEIIFTNNSSMFDVKFMEGKRSLVGKGRTDDEADDSIISTRIP